MRHWHSLRIKIKIIANSIGKNRKQRSSWFWLDLYVPFLQHRFLSRDKSAEYGPTFVSLHRQWWCFKIPETYSSWTKTPKFHIETSSMPVIIFSLAFLKSIRSPHLVILQARCTLLTDMWQVQDRNALKLYYNVSIGYRIWSF